MSHRRKHPAQHLGENEAGQGKAVRSEQGAERIAAALESCEAKADRRPEDDPVTGSEMADAQRHQKQGQKLDQLLNQADADIHKRTVLKQPRLQHGGRQDSQHASIEEGQEDPLT